jgi:hypothetical protein
MDLLTLGFVALCALFVGLGFLRMAFREQPKEVVVNTTKPFTMDLPAYQSVGWDVAGLNTELTATLTASGVDKDCVISCSNETRWAVGKVVECKLGNKASVYNPGKDAYMVCPEVKLVLPHWVVLTNGDYQYRVETPEQLLSETPWVDGPLPPSENHRYVWFRTPLPLGSGCTWFKLRLPD